MRFWVGAYWVPNGKLKQAGSTGAAVAARVGLMVVVAAGSIAMAVAARVGLMAVAVAGSTGAVVGEEVAGSIGIEPTRVDGSRGQVRMVHLGVLRRLFQPG